HPGGHAQGERQPARRIRTRGGRRLHPHRSPGRPVRMSPAEAPHAPGNLDPQGRAAGRHPLIRSPRSCPGGSVALRHLSHYIETYVQEAAAMKTSLEALNRVLGGRSLLGQTARDDADLIALVRDGLPYASFEHALMELELT